MIINFRCPICKRPLTRSEKALVCAFGHSFDLAKEGYVNLTTGSSSKVSGDNKEMVNARIAFLEKGYYEELRQEILDTELSLSSGSLLDVGAGTGYYTNFFAESIDNVFGIDISKLAVKYAAKKGSAKYAVASCYELPFAGDTFDTLTSIFSPKATAEYSRVLKKDGFLIEVCPAPMHLVQLKKLLYGDKAYVNEDKLAFDKPFALLKQKRITYSVVCSLSDTKALLEMTPYFYKTSANAKAKLDSIDQIELTLDFYIKVFSNLK